MCMQIFYYVSDCFCYIVYLKISNLSFENLIQVNNVIEAYQPPTHIHSPPPSHRPSGSCSLVNIMLFFITC